MTDGFGVLDAAFSRPDVLERVADILRAARSGAMGATLRRALRWPAMDRHLHDLALGAILPDVRAVAVQALIAGKAVWPTGFTRRWIDKRFNVFETVQSFDERPVERPRARELLVARAALDRTAAVRRVAAAALVDLHRELSNTDDIIRLLADDRSRAVRERVDFVRRARES